MVLLWHTKDNSVDLLLKIKWFMMKLHVLFSFYTGQFYLNAVPWLIPADTLTLIILKLLYIFTFKNYKYI